MVVAPFILAEGKVEPYVSLVEVKNSPTAAIIDFTNLIPDGSQVAQDIALQELIVRASSKADVHTMGIMGSLNATSNTENGRYRPNRAGEIIISPTFKPILAVTDFQVGWGPGQGLYDITLSTSNCSIERDQFIITAPTTLGLYFGAGLSIAGGRWGYQHQMYCQWTYVNGWANTFTAATVAAGATSVTVKDPTGIYPGMQITLWDGQNDETLNVSTSYVPGTSTITFQSGFQYAHGSNVNLSTIPAIVKQAVIHFIVGMVKERGQGALVLNEIGEPTAGHHTAMDEEAMAYDILDSFKAVWGRS